jgi:hypothetical protein
MSLRTPFLALCCLLSVAVPLYAADLSDLTWDATGATVIITDCDNAASGALVIPETIEGKAVTSIGDHAFHTCTSLASITLPDNLTNIGDGAFHTCTSLTSITLPDSVTSIGDYPFKNCTSLLAINVPPGNPAYSSEEGVLFNKCKSTLIKCPATKSGAYVIPDSVTTIGTRTFRDCTSLTSIFIPGTVTTIGRALYGCTSLVAIEVAPGNLIFASEEGVLFNKAKTTLVSTPGAKQGVYSVPEGVTSIGDYAFRLCTSLAGIFIPDSVTSIGDQAFRDCTSLEHVNMLGNAPSLGSGAFSGVHAGAAVYVQTGATGYGATFGSLPVISLDTAPPVITLLGANPQQVDRGTVYSELNASALDETDGDISGSIVIDSTAVDTATAGSYSVTYNVQDAAGNAAPEVTRTVVVVGPEPQVISIAVLGFNNDPLSSGDVSNDGSYTVTVHFSEPVQAIPGIVSGGTASYDVGTFTSADTGVTWTATHANFTGDGTMTIDLPTGAALDLAGNSNTMAATPFVLYHDTISPLITLLGANPQYMDRGTVYDEYNATATDDRDGSISGSIVIDSPGVDPATAGSYTVNYNVQDTAGNVAPEVTRTVVVVAPPPELVYVVNGSSVTITDCDEAATGTLAIPATIVGKPVTSIGVNAFRDCTSLTSITLPDNLTSIGSGAFWNCSSLTSINIPDCVTSIENEAFRGCSNLASINIPDSVTSIGYQAFRDCTALASITLPDSVTSIGSYAFASCTSLASINIPDSVTSIGDAAFQNCTGLTSITIPDSLTSIENEAFRGCSSLASIELPASLTSIGNHAFYQCTSLASINIPDSVTSIGSYAFYQCTSLTGINIPDSLTSIGDYAFYGCTSLASIDIPDSVTSIGDNAFQSCTSLASINIPDSVTSIGYAAFQNCTSLTSITIPGSVTSIENEAFRGCSSLASIELPDSLTSIGNNAFYQCTSLASINIPDSVTSIGTHAFRDCTELRRVHFDGALPTFGTAPFLATQSFITYPGSLTTVAGRPAFDSRHIPVPTISQLAGGDVCVSFQAAAGPHPSPYRYRVYKSPSLDAPFASWVQVGPEIIGADAPVQVDYTPQAGDSSLFLRTLVEFQ